MLFSKLFDDITPLDEYKSKELFPLTCPQCGETFHRLLKQVKYNVTHHRSDHMYCSRKCEGMNKIVNSKLTYEFICTHCGKENFRRPDRKTTNNRFCNRSCSVAYNNKNAPKRKKGIRKKYVSKKKEQIEPVLKYRTCDVCYNVDSTTGRFQSTTCKFCSRGCTYRVESRFSFDLRKYPDEFDLVTLSVVGMFHPKQNPKGMSRDHLYSVHEGKQNRVPPDIMKHPANCSLIMQSENSKKNKNSSISYEELLIRIDEWEKKYGGEC